MLRAGRSDSLDTLSRLGAGRAAAVHPTSTVGHCRRSAGGAPALGLGAAAWGVARVARAAAILEPALARQTHCVGCIGYFRPRPLVLRPPPLTPPAATTACPPGPTATC